MRTIFIADKTAGRAVGKPVGNTVGRLLAFVVLATLLASPLLTAGCNTFNGLGKDIEKGGQKMQNASGTQPQEW